MLALSGIALMAAVHRLDLPSGRACSPRPMPAPLDAAGERPIASEAFEFSALPSFAYPRRAWVVRISRRGDTTATLEVIRLLGEYHCNRWKVERRWRQPISQGTFAALAMDIVPLGTPSTDIFMPTSDTPLPEFSMDGTAVELRLASTGWRVVSGSEASSGRGARISSLFRGIMARLVPPQQIPEPDWRSPATAR